MKMHETHKVQYIMQGRFTELNVATFFIYLLFINNLPDQKKSLKKFKGGQ